MKEQKQYRVIYDGDHFIDGFEVETLEGAKSSAIEILQNWLDEAVMEEDDEAFDIMIYNCMTWVEEYNEETGEWGECWGPSDDDLKAIGWIAREEV